MHIETWQREWRRIGAALMGGAVLAALGWYEATQTFVVASKGTYDHSSFWNPILVPIGVAFIAGLYCFAATYYRHLPMLARFDAIYNDRRLADEAIRYSVVSELEVLVEPMDPPDPEKWKNRVHVTLYLNNGRDQVIQVNMLRIAESLEPGEPIERQGGMSARILPNKKQTLQLPPLDFIGVGEENIKGWVEFVLSYGRPNAPADLCFLLDKKIEFVIDDTGRHIHDASENDFEWRSLRFFSQEIPSQDRQVSQEDSGDSDDSALSVDFDVEQLTHDRPTPLRNAAELRGGLEAAIRRAHKREP